MSLLFPTGRPFADDDREFMMTVARLCGQALDRAQLYTQEHEVAEVLQRALLPPALPHVPGFTFDAAYETGGQKAEVGGDWYDAFRLPRGHVVLCVGDVVGRGLRAATLMGQLRHTIRTVAFESYSPSMMIERAQAVLRHSYGREAMATAAVGVLDPFESTLTYSTAGHPPPAVMRGNDAIERLELGSLPLGVAHLGTCPERVVQLSAGDAVIFYTDGLIEATRDVKEGEERLLTALRTERDASSYPRATAILRSVLGAAVPKDDVAVLTVGVIATDDDRVDITLAATPVITAQVRHAFRRLARKIGLGDDQSFGVAVALGEALNNAIEHA